MNTISNELRRMLDEAERVNFTHGLFGLAFPLRLEPAVYQMAGLLSADYKGGLWQFFSLANGGFYMAPATTSKFDVVCENGFEGELSPDALGLTACLYAYSHLSFAGDSFAEVCASQYHLLRAHITGHAEVQRILAAID